MGLRVYGICAAQNPDNAGETIILDGLDHSRLNRIKDEHDHDDFFHSVGAIDLSKKIYKKEDCENDKQLRCWREAQVPFLYVEGQLADDTEHPNARSAASIIKFCQRPDVPLAVGFSVDGGIAERRTESGQITENREAGKVLAKTLAMAASLTVKPCNPRCKLFLENDLQKSVMQIPAPANYHELLRKSQAASSITEIDDPVFQMYMKLNNLKKSLDDYFSGFTSVQCYQCGTPIRFFKNNKDLPNMCTNCGSSFSLNSLWTALNK